jgi:hypothetical protein
MLRRLIGVLVLSAAAMTAACQNPTDPDNVTKFDDALDVTASPNPIVADAATGGRTYRVVRGNNQPDEILAYDWHAIFNTTLTFNSKATSDDVDVAFPIKITSTTVAVKQASGGIVTTPTGGDTEKYDFVINASGNAFAAVGTPVSTGFEIWYDLPSLLKEAVVTLTFTFVDDDGATYQKAVDFNVAP